MIIGKNVTIEEGAQLGKDISIYDFSCIRKGAIVGDYCKIARNVYIDSMAIIGNRVKIQNRNNISNGVILQDGVFVGPNVTFSNDKYPRSITPNGKLKNNTDWILEKTIVKYGASIGAGAVIVCGITIGKWALIGAGAVVTKNVPDFALVMGNPARICGWVSESGQKMEYVGSESEFMLFYCKTEDKTYKIPLQ